VPGNVEIVEQVPFGQMNDYYRQAGALVNTSVFEGFPRAFLEAGRCGVPVLALDVDPDGFLTRGPSGIFASGSLEKMAEGLRLLMSDSEASRDYSRNIKAFVAARQETDAELPQLDALLREVLVGK
jgi:glycosyltransferase involved in cell wall biosynthesis